ncbi:MAG: alkaline phosphatase family protein [Candidatus Azobacteroides sp.]|nr:alkaline phosphatase family protein [Candidatus Azobacteroides sp.]
MKNGFTYFLLFVLTVFSSCTETETKKTLFIGIDGLIWQAINETDAPFLKELMDNSWTNTLVLTEVPTYSSNGWSALLTGVRKEKHGYYINNEPWENTNLKTYPSFFQHLKNSYPYIRTASFVSWQTINEKIVRDAATVTRNGNDNGDKDYVMKDQYIYKEALKEIQCSDVASIIFLHFDQIDGAGHATGFDIKHSDYRKALKQIDEYISELFATVKQRPEYKKEDWLFVVVTDHGGTSTGHGGDSFTEQNAFIILNNKAITSYRNSSTDTLYLYHIPPTIFDFMGFPILEEYNWDGKSLIEFSTSTTKTEKNKNIKFNN